MSEDDLAELGIADIEVGVSDEHLSPVSPAEAAPDIFNGLPNALPSGRVSAPPLRAGETAESGSI